MHPRALLGAAKRRLAFLLPRSYWQRQAEDAKALWMRTPPTGCPNAPRIYEAAAVLPSARILEFGANTGGNLTYFLDRHPTIQATGIDINPIVAIPESTYPTYRAIVGDDAALSGFEPDAFDVAFTISVLDHIPDPVVVKRVLSALIRLSPLVILLEPMIPGVHGDVSGRPRAEFGSGFPLPHKRFAPHSYVWDYERWLSQMGVTWTRESMPLHTASLGPFYQRIVVRRSTSASD